MSLSKIDKQRRYRITRKTTFVGVWINLFLAISQLLGGIFANSQALLADGLHTFSDLAGDFIVLFAAKIASKEADDDHHYGHGRFETLATVILGLILIMVAIGIATKAMSYFFFSATEAHIIPSNIALIFAALAIVSKEGLYHYTVAQAKRINSDLLKANAWHHRSDAMSSIMVFVGVLGAIVLQLPWLDSAAAILVAIMISVMGVNLVLNSVNELLDSAIDVETVQILRELIINSEGVKNLHMLRTRRLGGRIYADVHIQVSSYISVSEGHLIAEKVMEQLAQQFEQMEDITVHIDPEDDEVLSSCSSLASRSQLQAQIEPLLTQFQLNECFIRMQLHYLDEAIEIDIFLKGDNLSENRLQLRRFCQAGEKIKDVSSVSLHQQL